MASKYVSLNEQAQKDPTLRDKEQAKTYEAGVQGFDSHQEMMDYAGTQTYSQYGQVQNDGTVVGGVKRPVAPGDSSADAQHLSDQGYANVQQQKANYDAAKKLYEQAKLAGNAEAMKTHQSAMDAAHAAAEKERARAGYSGGTDGSMYLAAADQDRTLLYGVPEEEAWDYNEWHANAYGPGGTGATGGSQSDLKGLLDQWKEAALQQQNGQIDFAVAQAVTQLERALADAQPMFKEQAESIAREERQALDNSALYAEARGDRGGIGQSQYNEIQAAAAQNHLAVQQAQTKLATDTARQIEDLRAQGEFQKADAALQIAQTYLSQLISLEQWAAEYNLSQQQFQESVRQWEAEFSLAMQQFQVDTDLAYGSATGRLPSTGQLTLQGQGQLADMGAAMLDSGIMPSDEQLMAMGITKAQANQYLMNLQLQSAGKGGGGNKQSSSYTTVSKKAAKYETAEEALGYLNNMVAIGAISEDEKNYIYQVELGATFDGGAGMDLARFRAAEQVLEMQLKSGLVDNAQSHVNAIWRELNNQQKNALRELFNVYGYATEEE